MADGQLPFPFDDASQPTEAGESEALTRDADARVYAVNPAVNVALEASAGTGKTRVLVDRYVNLLRLGIEPRRVLAITFTRKAAAEMRARIVAELARMAESGEMPEAIWRELRGRLSEIAISTIDAFCLSLLGEFPLEADVDPGFGVADETETPRLMNEALDRTLRIGRAQSAHDPDLALLFARMGEQRLRQALMRLLDRRLVAVDALDRFLRRSPAGLTAERAAARAVEKLRLLFGGLEGVAGFRATGPDVVRFTLLTRGLEAALAEGAAADPGQIADLAVRLREHFLTQSGSPRKRALDLKALFPSPSAYTAHGRMLQDLGPGVIDLIDAHRGDVNVVLTRSLRWLTARALEQYRRTLDEHAMVDFTDGLVKALALLAQMEEFSQSRYRLEARYQHVLVDELQDTSRPQWRLVELLVQAWGEGAGLAHEGPAPPSIFVVGDRKQSIYGFRDADVGVLDEAARLIGRLRPGREPRRAIVKSFRALPALQHFVNDVCEEIGKVPERRDAFRFGDLDRFPIAGLDGRSRPVGIVVGPDAATCARAVAGEVARLLRDEETVRDRHTGVPRAIVPGDVAILFRSRDSHREFERELERVGVPFYVYKGLGFFDADEVKDVLALIRYLAEPDTHLHAAAFLRSRFVRLSDEALKILAPSVAESLRAPAPPAVMDRLSREDQDILTLARASVAAWTAMADRLPPAELVDRVLHDSAYAFEIRGAGHVQARENLKKLRGLMRRLQNRGYATLSRIAERVSQLMAGDESNAIIDALDAVNLMTVHAAKGLEFPVVFVMNLSRGTGGRGDAVDVVTRVEPDGEVVDLVSVDELADDARREIEAREREESKRLVYVALTRARDRLYLGTTLGRQGLFAPAPTALGQVLPPSFAPVFSMAATATEGWVAWQPATGAAHQLRVVTADAIAIATAPAVVAATAVDDFEPVHVGGSTARSVTAMAAADADDPRAPVRSRPRESARAVGRLVHRAIAAGALERDDRDRAVVGEAGHGEDAATRAAATEVLNGLAARADVQALISGSDVEHEIPLSWRGADGVVVRAIVDMLVRRPNGSATVVEFKTGAPRAADERQLAAYVAGIRALLPEITVDGRMIRLDV